MKQTQCCYVCGEIYREPYPNIARCRRCNRPLVLVCFNSWEPHSSEAELIPVSENPITSRMYKDKIQRSRGKAK